MHKKIIIGSSILITILGSVAVYASFSDDVFPWLQEYELTRYDNEDDFRPDDSITRGETAKFVSQYADAMQLDTIGGTCTFNDISTYDSTLTPYITQSCNFGLLKGSKNMFMPHNRITEAQALTMVIRSLYGYQDETITPWYHHYYMLGKTVGLITDETEILIDTTYITRRKLAEWLYTAFNSEDIDSGQDGYIYETDVDNSADCTSYETYDGNRNVCYFTCDSEQQCADINAQIDDELASWTDALETDDRNMDEQAGEQSAEKTSKVIYNVLTDEKITKKQGTDNPTYQSIWSDIAELAPDSLSKNYLETFEIFDDTNSDVAAFVVDEDGNGKWHMAVNLAIHNESDIKEQKATLIHELSHIITLNKDQMMTPSGQCPTYETEEGCTKSSSYLNQFYQKFRKNINNPDLNDSMFVTEYATTNVEEDIAESFAFFVLESNHNTTTVRNQKVQFFNAYPELVTIRQQMRNVLAKYAIKLRKI